MQQIEPRPLTDSERRLIDRLLQESFAGSNAVRAQMADAEVVEEGRLDTRTLVFGSPAPGVPRANNDARVPVDAVMMDDDGAHIEILLHLVDGLARELEAYRPDGCPIKRQSLDGQLVFVNWKQAD